MKRSIAFLLTGALSAFVLFACTQERRVQAGREDQNQPGRSDTYQPSTAPGSESARSGMAQQDIKGELRKVDMAKNTIVVRTDNGLEQTFRYTDNTTVSGLPSSSATAPTGRQKPSGGENNVHSLMGKEGSEVTVHWTQQGDDKVATSIDVSQMSTKGKSKSY
jgi:hypothetical protein